jgi:hypothetical protein
MAACQSTLVGTSDNPACLAFWDTAAGLVPVKVLALLGNGNADVRRLCLNDAKVLFEITANRGALSSRRGPDQQAAPCVVTSARTEEPARSVLCDRPAA